MPPLVETDALVEVLSGVGGSAGDPLPDPFDNMEDTLDFWEQEQREVENQGDRFWDDQDLSAPSLDDFTPGSPAQMAAANARMPKSYTNFQEADAAASRGWKDTYENGQIPQDALFKIADGHYLREDAGRAFKAMRRAAAKMGVNITITDSYRDLATQERLAAEKGLYSKGGLAAVPGTSEHGWGLAVDVDQGREWLAEHGHKFGFKTIPREPWHWEYDGSYKVANKPDPKAKKPKPKRMREEPTAVADDFVAPEFSALTAIPGLMMEVMSERPVRNPNRNRPIKNQKVPGFVPDSEKRFFLAAARATGLPVRLLALVAQKESGFGPNKSTISSAGAIGRMQLMPGTAEGLGVDPYNLRQNIMGGARYLAQQVKTFNGNLRFALAAYNAGPNARESNPGGWQQGLGYADDILDLFRS